MERRSIAPLVGALLGAFGLVLAGCQTTTGSASPAATTSGTGSEFDDASRGMTAPEPQGDSTSVLQPVYFAFDSADIRTDARNTLRTNGDAMKRNRRWGTITVEGHCDERGSEEYNLALGDRRARRVRDYLVDLGVDRSRLRTVSFGEAKPAVMGHDESAWRYNRRVDFKVR